MAKGLSNRQKSIPRILREKRQLQKYRLQTMKRKKLSAISLQLSAKNIKAES
jgi:hypothetical protein